MEVILKFDLSLFDDEIAHLQCVNAPNMAMAIWEFASNSKKKLEWAMEGQKMDKYKALDMVFEEFYEILKENHVNYEELCP